MAATNHFFSIYEALSNHLATQLAANSITWPVVRDFDDGEGLTLTNGFFYFSVMFATSEGASANRINVTQRKIRTRGAAYIEVRVPRVGTTTGMQPVMEKADLVASFFRDKTINNIIIEKAVVEIPRTMRYGKGEFWALPVICDFRFDEVVAV
jgi:hypothetical protein